MLRTLPPHGRVASLALIAAALMIVLAAPAHADGHVRLDAAEQVAGLQPLVLIPEGLKSSAPLTLQITDVDGDVATWRYDGGEVENREPLLVDVALPREGLPPRNGPAEITLSSPSRTLATATTVIDRAPAVPTLSSVVRGQRVGLTWDPVAAAQPVTYRLERIATGGSWTVLEEGDSADGYTDRGLEPGRYRYRLSAALPAADGDGLNWSALSAVQVKITREQPTASPTPDDQQPSDEPATDDADQEGAEPAEQPQPTAQAEPAPKAERDRKARPRDVAATGGVRGPVDDSAEPEGNSAPAIATADEPAVDAPAPPVAADDAAASPEAADPGVPTPEAAPADAADDDVAPPMEPFPVTVPAAGALAVQTGTRTPPDPVTMLTGFAFLLLGSAVVRRQRMRAGLHVIQAWVGRR